MIIRHSVQFIAKVLSYVATVFDCVPKLKIPNKRSIMKDPYLSFYSFILLFFILPSPLFSQIEKEDVLMGSKHRMYSKIMNEERSYSVYLPPTHHDPSLVEKYPVLYILDGDWYFPIAAGIVQYSKGSFKMPEMIIVAISNTDRIRDFTPSNAALDMFGNKIQGLENSGGGDNFLKFLKEELIPHIEDTYRAMPYRILVGHSFGGLFATHAFISAPSLFQSYVMIDPSLWWNRQEQVEKMEKFLGTDLAAKRTVFFGEADNKNMASTDNSPHVQAMEALKKLFESSASIRYKSQYFEQETHASVGVPALYYGLSYLFEGYRPADSVFSKVSLLTEHYLLLSQKWGVNFTPPESLVRNLGLGAQYGEKNIEKAMSFFQLNIDNYPRSSDACKVMGEAYMAKGNNQEARSYFERSLVLNPENSSARDKLKELDKD